MATATATKTPKVTQTGRDTRCIFHQPWWLDAVSPGQWGEAVVQHGGDIRARLPYAHKKLYGLTALTMPPLTPRLGPWLDLQAGTYARRMAQEKELLGALIAQLPRFDVFCHHFVPEITNWLPFYWTGFQETTRYTYRLENLTDLGEIRAGFHRTTREQIQKAERVVAVRDDLGIEHFMEMNRKTYARQGLPLPYSADIVRRIDAVCALQQCRKIFFAEDSQGNTHAALYVVWDQQCAYSLLSGSDPEWRRSGAGALLFWRAIQMASEQGKCFDFEGSMIEPVERHFRNYGARQVPYFRVWKLGRAIRMFCAGAEFWQALLGKQKQQFIWNPTGGSTVKDPRADGTVASA